MGTLGNINMQSTGDPAQDMRQYQIELERRLRHLFRNIDVSSIILGLTSSRLVATDASGNLDSVGVLSSWIAGTSGNVTITDDGAGGVIIKAIGSSRNINTFTDTDTLTVAQQGVIICNKATAMTINLPTAVGNEGVTYSITSINSGTVTIGPNGAETIQGDATFDIYEDENFQIVSDDANWIVG